MGFLKKYHKNFRPLLLLVVTISVLAVLLVQAGCCFDFNYDFSSATGKTSSDTGEETKISESETAQTIPEDSTQLIIPELSIISKLKIPGQAIDVKAFGGYAYLTNDLGILFIIDVKDKENPQITGKCQGINAANIVILKGEYAYISYTEWISVDDDSDVNRDEDRSLIDFLKKLLKKLASIIRLLFKDSTNTEWKSAGKDDEGQQDGQTNDDASATPKVYSICGFKIVDISDKKNPSVVGDYISGHGEEKSVQGLVINGDYAYLNTTDYSENKLESSLEIVDIKDKTRPVLYGNCDIEGQPNGIFVEGDFAYINNTYYDFNKKEYLDESKFFIIDVSDKKKPRITGSCEVPANSWSVYARENNAYLTSSIYDQDIDDYKASLLQVVNISDPKNPQPEGKCSIPGGAWEIDIKDDFLLVSNNEGGVSVINISDSSNPAITTSLSTDGNSYDIAVSGDYGYIADGFNGLIIIGLQKKEPGEGMIVEGEEGTNMPPVASIDVFGDELAGGLFKEDNPIYFSATDSYDPEGNDLTYSWTVNGTEIEDINNKFVLGDYIENIGLKSEMTEEKNKLICIFENPGTYEIILTVSDGILKSEEAASVTIEKQEIVIEPLREHNFSVIIECLLQNNSDIELKNLECYLRAPQTFYPYQVVNSIEASIPLVNEVFDQDWNLLTHFKFGNNITVQAGKELTASLKSEVTMYEYEFKEISSKNMDYEIGDKDLKEYTGEDIFIDIDSPVIIDAVKKATGNETDPVAKAKKIYNYIASKLYYDFPRANDREYEFMSASEILKTGKGVCADYAILYVAMLRTAGIPSRVAAGIPSTLIMREKGQELDVGHAWVELKLPGYGWIPVDITQEDGFMNRDYYMNLTTEKGTTFLYESMTMDWSSYYYDGFKYKWDGTDAPDVEQKLIYKVRDISFSDLYYK